MLERGSVVNAFRRVSVDVDLELAVGAAAVVRDFVAVVARLAPQAVDAAIAAARDV